MTDAPSTPSARIAVVDDDEDSRELFVAVLRINGFEAEPFATAEDALAAVRERRPDAVLLDITLAGSIDGYELARRLGAAGDPGVPVLVAVTGHSASKVRNEGVRFDAVFTKPVDPDVLVAELRRLIGSR
jgi:CheY-like chemotaxis protein